MDLRVGQSLLLTMALVLAAPAHAEERVTSGTAVKGEVTLVTAELCVVKDGAGKGVMMQIDERTTIEGSLRPGIQVEALVAPDGRAVSIRTVQR